MPSRIFISYRRDDSAGHAGRLYDALASRFGPDQLFVDVDNIEPGQDFVERVQEVVAAVDVLLAVIGKDWVDTRAADGTRRLDDPQDLVRVEVEAALQRSILVIPVLVEGAAMPGSAQLPGSMQSLARRNASVLDDRDWKHSVERLVAAIDDVVGPNASAAPADAGRPTWWPSWLRRLGRTGAAALVGCLALSGVAVAWAWNDLQGGHHPGPTGAQRLWRRFSRASPTVSPRLRSSLSGPATNSTASRGRSRGTRPGGRSRSSWPSSFGRTAALL